MGFLKHNLFTSRKMTVSNDINENGAIYLDSEGVVIDETGELIEFTEEQEKVLSTVDGFEKYELGEVEREVGSKKSEVSEKPEEAKGEKSNVKSETEEEGKEVQSAKRTADKDQKQEENEKIEENQEQDKEESSEQTESKDQSVKQTADEEKILSDEKPKKTRNTKTKE